MVLLAKIVGFALILFGAAAVMFAIPSYRALISEETRFYLVSTTLHDKIRHPNWLIIRDLY